MTLEVDNDVIKVTATRHSWVIHVLLRIYYDVHFGIDWFYHCKEKNMDLIVQNGQLSSTKTKFTIPPLKTTQTHKINLVVCCA